MAQPKYYDLNGQEVFFYHAVDGIEALELGNVTVAGVAPKKAPAPVVEEVKEEAPAVEEVAEEVAEEVKPEAPKKAAPRRRKAA